jgi:hypothetical protein
MRAALLGLALNFVDRGAAEEDWAAGRVDFLLLDVAPEDSLLFGGRGAVAGDGFPEIAGEQAEGAEEARVGRWQGLGSGERCEIQNPKA